MPGNRKRTGRRRANSGSFRPGQSGNPAGRPPMTPEEREVRDLARQMTPEVLLRLYRLGSAKGAAAVRANEAIWDRAWGRPRQAVELEGKDGEPLQVSININLGEKT